MKAIPAPPIRVLTFLNGFAFGGTEKQAGNLVRALDRSKFELHVGCLKAVGHLASEFQTEAASFVEYRIDHLYNHRALKQLMRLARDIRRRGIDIVHTYGFYGNVFAIPAARLAGTPVVIASIRDMGNVWTSRQRLVQRLVCRLADCILVNAEAVKQQLIFEGYDATKISVISNGIVLPDTRSSSCQAGLHQEFGLPPGAPLVAVLSVLRREKGIEYFLDAARIISQRRPDARFLIVGDSVYRAPGSNESVGDSSYREELESYAKNLGLQDRVIFTGFRFDAAAVLSQACVSVLPTLTEALSNTILESMAAGKPVVATNVGGNPEAVVDGLTGLLVPPRDPAALADAISCVLADPERASRMGEAGRQRVTERFSVDAMVRATEKLYLDLLTRKTAALPRAISRLGARPVA
jgi:glycosyltransferase involved in cell wall biosynthesis